jgi:hypothetical protein
MPVAVLFIYPAGEYTDQAWLALAEVGLGSRPQSADAAIIKKAGSEP